MEDEALMKLGTTKRDLKRKCIDAPCNYEILSNIKYQDMFAFETIDMRNLEDKESIDTSDFVSRVIYNKFENL